jgi:hypothetical protein
MLRNCFWPDLTRGRSAYGRFEAKGKDITVSGDLESWTDSEFARIETGTSPRRPSNHQSMFK